MFDIFKFKYELSVQGEAIHLISRTTPAKFFGENIPFIGTIGDHNAQQLSFDRPGFEDYELVLLFESEGTERISYPEQNLFQENEFSIPNALTQNPLLHMQIQLRDGQTLIAGSQTVSMAFRPAITPGGTTLEPLTDPVYRFLNGCVMSIGYNNGILSTYNQYGHPLESIEIGGMGLAIEDGDMRYTGILYAEKTGNSSITLDDVSVSGPRLAGLTISGASQQNGTPSPTSPISLECAQPTTVTISSENVSRSFTLPGVLRLYGEDNISDTFDVVSGTLTRRYRLATLTGESTIFMTETIEGYSTFIVANLNDLERTQAINGKKCTHFPVIGNTTNPDSCCMYQGSNTQYLYFRIPNTLAVSVNDFKTWLDAQNSAGTPVMVLYRMINSLPSTLESQSIPIYAPSCTITSNAGTLKVVYPQDINLRLANMQTQINSLMEDGE